MRYFSWKYFTLTGDVESFMLYKEMDQMGAQDQASELAGVEDTWVSSEDEAIQ